MASRSSRPARTCHGGACARSQTAPKVMRQRDADFPRHGDAAHYVSRANTSASPLRRVRQGLLLTACSHSLQSLLLQLPIDAPQVRPVRHRNRRALGSLSCVRPTALFVSALAAGDYGACCLLGKYCHCREWTWQPLHPPGCPMPLAPAPRNRGAEALVPCH